MTYWQGAEKGSGMLRVPQHERKITNDINSLPFVPSSSSGPALSIVEGLREDFSATYYGPAMNSSGTSAIRRYVFEPTVELYLILSSSGAVAVATSKVFKVQASM